MFSDLNYLDYVIILFGVLLCLKRVAEMERYHTLRVAVLSVVLGGIVGFLFLAFALSLGEPFQFDCTGAEHFTCTEM